MGFTMILRIYFFEIRITCRANYRLKLLTNRIKIYYNEYNNTE